MSKYEDRNKSIGALVRALKDAHLGTNQSRGIPIVQNETAQSRLFRIIEYVNPEIWEDTSTNAISKEVIITLLQCAARLYEGGVHIKKAVDLIESEDTRAVLSLGIQDNLSQTIHQRHVEYFRSNMSEATNAENYSQQARLFSAIQKNKGRRLNYQAMIIEHISSLCRSHGSALQNTFEGPIVDDHFMFQSYMTLSKTLNPSEKSWLVTLLPDILQWEIQESCSNVNGLEDGLLVPNLTTIKEAKQDVYKSTSEAITSSQDTIAPYIIQSVNSNSNTSDNRPLSVELADRSQWSCPWDLDNCNNGDMQHWLERAITEEGNKLLRICEKWGIQNQKSDPKLLADTKEVLDFEKWVDLLRERAVAYCNLASLEAVTSVSKAANKSHNQATCQNDEDTRFDKKIERQDACSYDKSLNDGIESPLEGTSEIDLSFLESDDDNECIFPFSPDGIIDSSSAKPFPLYDAGLLSETSAKETQSTFTLISPSSTSLETIPEETQEQLELEEKEEWRTNFKLDLL